MYYKEAEGYVFIKVLPKKVTVVKLYGFLESISIMDKRMHVPLPHEIKSNEAEFNEAFKKALKKLL